MSAEVLRKAASLMRERSDNATGSPWQHIPIEDEDGAADSYVISLTGFTSIGEDVGEGMAVGDAEHIASWHPAVALAVADWLDDALDAHLHVRPGNYQSYLKAVEVARAYLGSDA